MLDYDKKHREALDKNVNSLKNSLAKKKIPLYLERKIENFAKKYNRAIDEIKNKLLNEEDGLFALFFVKDPGRQSLHQKAACTYLKSFSEIKNFKMLPSGGPSALYIQNGMIVSGQNLTTNRTGKSIDFYWEYVKENGDVLKCYATHKYTKDVGGSQDNQFKDVCDFFRNAALCVSPNTYFFAICDGPFYRNFAKYSYQNLFGGR